jgi:hypothetical protein
MWAGCIAGRWILTRAPSIWLTCTPARCGASRIAPTCTRRSGIPPASGSRSRSRRSTPPVRCSCGITPTGSRGSTTSPVRARSGRGSSPRGRRRGIFFRGDVRVIRGRCRIWNVSRMSTYLFQPLMETAGIVCKTSNYDDVGFAFLEECFEISTLIRISKILESAMIPYMASFVKKNGDNGVPLGIALPPRKRKDRRYLALLEFRWSIRCDIDPLRVRQRGSR